LQFWSPRESPQFWADGRQNSENSTSQRSFWKTVAQSGLIIVSHFDLKASWSEMKVKNTGILQSKTLF
jgi:hypothetical protein